MLQNDYSVIDQTGFDKSKLQPGEIVVRVDSFREKKDKEQRPIIELGLELHWAANKDDHDYLGQKFDHAFFFGKNAGITVRQLREFFKASGFNTRDWTADNQLPESVAFPGALKLLAYKGYYCLCKLVTAAPRAGQDGNAGAAMFMNFIKIVRNDPVTGEPLGSYPPEPVPNDLILEAYNAKLEGAAESGLPF